MRSVRTDFSDRVLSVVRRIPPGRVASYGEVAKLAGRPRAARAVGNVMRGCARPDVPCHRVIAAGGRLGGYGGSEVLKRALLVAEGVVVSGSRIRELARVRWQPPRRRRWTQNPNSEPGTLNPRTRFLRICLRRRPKATPANPLPV